MRILRIPPLALFLCLVLSACIGPGAPQPEGQKPGARVHLFLQPLPQETQRLTLTLGSLSARRVDGTDIRFADGPLILAGDNLIGVQKKLQSVELPLGDYAGLLVEIDSATLLSEDGRNDLLVPQTPVFIEQRFQIARQRDLALFLTLSGDRLVKNGYQFNPTFSVSTPQPTLPNLKGAVSNTVEGTLTLFEKSTPKVVALVAVGMLPRDLAIDPAGRRVFVALEGNDAIAEVDLVTETLQSQIRLRPGDDPRALSLAADGTLLAVVNAGSRSLSLIDAFSLFERNRIHFSSQPSAAFFGITGDHLYVLQPSSSRISRIDTGRAQNVVSNQLEEAPFRGEPGSHGRQLYLLTENSPDLLIVDAVSLAVLDRKYVGYGPLSLAVDRHNELIYVGLITGEVVILDARLGVPIDSLLLPEAAIHLSIDPEENALYAVLPKRKRLEKIDLISKKLVGGIDLGPGGYAAAVVGE